MIGSEGYFFVQRIMSIQSFHTSYHKGILCTSNGHPDSFFVLRPARAVGTTDSGYSLFKNSSITDNVNSVVLLP